MRKLKSGQVLGLFEADVEQGGADTGGGAGYQLWTAGESGKIRECLLFGLSQCFPSNSILTLGSYLLSMLQPVHFHLCRDVDGSKVSKNVILNSTAGEPCYTT